MGDQENTYVSIGRNRRDHGSPLWSGNNWAYFRHTHQSQWDFRDSQEWANECIGVCHVRKCWFCSIPVKMALLFPLRRRRWECPRQHRWSARSLRMRGVWLSILAILITSVGCCSGLCSEEARDRTDARCFARTAISLSSPWGSVRCDTFTKTRYRESASIVCLF